MHRRLTLMILYLAGIAASSGRLSAADDACGNPRALRIGVITFLGLTHGSGSDRIDRSANIERRFQDALIKRLAPISNTCVVRDIEVFDQPENYPALKGSLIFEIRASPSSQDPKVAAIAVDMFSPEGPYIGQCVSLGFLPILIQSDADFSAGAQAVMDHWTQVGKALDKLSTKKILE